MAYSFKVYTTHWKAVDWINWQRYWNKKTAGYLKCSIFNRTQERDAHSALIHLLFLPKHSWQTTITLTVAVFEPEIQMSWSFSSLSWIITVLIPRFVSCGCPPPQRGLFLIWRRTVMSKQFIWQLKTNVDCVDAHETRPVVSAGEPLCLSARTLPVFIIREARPRRIGHLSSYFSGCLWT